MYGGSDDAIGRNACAYRKQQARKLMVPRHHRAILLNGTEKHSPVICY